MPAAILEPRISEPSPEHSKRALFPPWSRRHIPMISSILQQNRDFLARHSGCYRKERDVYASPSRKNSLECRAKIRSFGGTYQLIDPRALRYQQSRYWQKEFEQRAVCFFVRLR